jgi:hypothetical protein
MTTFAEIRSAADRAREIPLEQVLVRSGAQRDPRDPTKWRTVRGVLSVHGPKFMNWQRGVGGGGAIDLAMHLHAMPFRAAVDWLIGRAGAPVGARSSWTSVRREFRVPPADAGQLARVKGYLVGARGLAEGLVDALVADGSVYADGRSNAVFLVRDAERRPVGAELRGTSPRRWRGMAAGSRKDRGTFSVPVSGARSAILCESAIDAMSCALLWPERLALSTSGARANPGWLPDLLVRGMHVYCGFDADRAGDDLAAALLADHPAVERLRPPLPDWNDVLRARR